MNDISDRVKVSSIESVPADLRHKLRSDTHAGTLFIAAADLTRAQLQRLTEVVDETEHEPDRKIKAIAEASSNSGTTVETPTIKPKQFTMKRSQMKANIQAYARLREEAMAEGQVVMLIEDDEVPAAK